MQKALEKIKGKAGCLGDIPEAQGQWELARESARMQWPHPSIETSQTGCELDPRSLSRPAEQQTVSNEPERAV
jgi:hypothetical protein